jgi:hypothetical protein
VGRRAHRRRLILMVRAARGFPQESGGAGRAVAVCPTGGQVIPYRNGEGVGAPRTSRRGSGHTRVRQGDKHPKRGADLPGAAPSPPTSPVPGQLATLPFSGQRPGGGTLSVPSVGPSVSPGGTAGGRIRDPWGPPPGPSTYAAFPTETQEQTETSLCSTSRAPVSEVQSGGDPTLRTPWVPIPTVERRPAHLRTFPVPSVNSGPGLYHGQPSLLGAPLARAPFLERCQRDPQRMAPAHFHAIYTGAVPDTPSPGTRDVFRRLRAPWWGRGQEHSDRLPNGHLGTQCVRTRVMDHHGPGDAGLEPLKTPCPTACASDSYLHGPARSASGDLSPLAPPAIRHGAWMLQPGPYAPGPMPASTSPDRSLFWHLQLPVGGRSIHLRSRLSPSTGRRTSPALTDGRRDRATPAWASISMAGMGPGAYGAPSRTPRTPAGVGTAARLAPSPGTLCV